MENPSNKDSEVRDDRVVGQDEVKVEREAEQDEVKVEREAEQDEACVQTPCPIQDMEKLSVALPFCDDKSDDEENEIFFGEITDKERRIADKYGKRRTILFDPRFRKDKKLMRNTIDNANERLQQENNYSLSDCFSTELKSQHKRRTVKFERILSNVEEERANENVMYQSTPSDPIDCTSNDCEQSKSIQDESMNIAASNEQVFSVANHEITDQRNEALTSSELNPDVNSCRSLNLSHCSGDSENQCASTDSLIKSYGTGLPVTTNDTIRSTNITGDTNLNDLETKNVGDFPILDCQADEDEIINCIDAHLDKISKSRNVSATTELENGVTSDTDITRMAVSDDIEIADEQDVIICNVSQINKQSRNFDAGEKDVQNVELIDRNSETVFGLTDMREALKGVDMITPDGPYEVNYCENNSIEAECNKQSVKQHDPRIAPFRVKTHEDRFYLKPPSSDIDSFKTDSSIKKDSHVMNVEDTTHRVRCDRVTPNCESLKNETNHINFTASYDQHDIRTEPTKHNVDDQDEEIEVLSSSDNLDKKDDSSRMNVDHADTEGRYSIAGIGNISVESIDQTHNYEGECESSFNADDSSMFNLKSLADTFYYDGEFFSINEFSSTASLSSRSGTRDRGRRKPPKPAVEDQALCSPNVPSTLTSPMTSFVVPPTMQAEPTSLRGQASLDDSMSPLGFTPYIPINMDRVLQQQQQWRQQQQQQQSQAPQSTTPAHRQAPQNTAPFYQPTNQMDVLTSNVQSLTNSDRELATEIPTSSEHYSQLNSQQMVSSYDVMSRPQESSHTQQSYGIIVHTETYSDEEDKENSPPVDDLRHPPNIQSTNINPAAYNDKLCKARDYSGMSNFSMNGVDIGERFKTMDYNDDDGGVKYVDERGYDSPMHHRQEMESVTKNAKVDGDNQKIEIGNDCTPSTLAAKKAYLQKIKAEKEEISKRMKSKAARLHPQSPVVKSFQPIKTFVKYKQPSLAKNPASIKINDSLDQQTLMNTLCNSQRSAEPCKTPVHATVIRHMTPKSSTKKQKENIVDRSTNQSSPGRVQSLQKSIFSKKSPAARGEKYTTSGVTQRLSPIVVSKIKRTNTLASPGIK